MRIRKPAIFWLSGFTVILTACTGAQQTEPPPTATAEPVTTATVETTTTVETATTVAPTTSVPSCEELVAGTTPPARGFAPMVTLEQREVSCSSAERPLHLRWEARCSPTPGHFHRPAGPT
jgi:hypothetical protein